MKSLIATIFIFLLPQFSQAQQWEVIPCPNQGTQGSELAGVDGVIDNEVWAVGSFDTVIASISRTWTLIEKWDGASWTIVPSPNPNNMYNFLVSAEAIAQDNVYAVGSTAGIPATSQMMILHWDGSSWGIESTPIITGGSSLYGINAVSSDNIWAVGAQDIGAPGPDVGTLTLHWNGNSWDTLSSPNVANRWNGLYSVKAISPDNIWAVGYSRNLSETYKTLIEHWDGSGWSVVASPNQGLESFLYSVAIISATDIWATGAYNDGTTYVPLFLHWNGSEWSIANSPAGGSSTSFIDAVDGWSAGGNIARWNGTEWSDVQAPVPGDGSLSGLKIISSGSVWAVGRVIINGIGQTLTMHYSAAVPVEFISFNATVDGSYAELNWSTSTETNNKGFNIERKSDGNWGIIGYVGGNGTSTEKHNYSFRDKMVDPNANTKIYYRLKQIDYNGNYKYSDQIELSLVPAKFSLSQNFPNPFNPTTKIKFTVPTEGFVSLKVYDVIGNEVAELVKENRKSGTHEVTFDASDLSSGVYFYKINISGQSGDFVQTKKMILLK